MRFLDVCPRVVFSIVGAVSVGTIALSLHAEDEGQPPPRPGLEALGIDTSPVTIPGAERFDLCSKSGLTYRIFVAGPTGEAPESGWPVLYLTDGNGDFPILLAAARRQSRGGLGMVVVGIGYPTDDRAVQLDRRAFDYTPTPTVDPPEGFPRYPSGGNDQFLEFIKDELKPLIERNYAIDRRRQALFGHSFGGLFVLHALFNEPGSFQTYLASSPSTWWDGGSIRAEADAFAEEHAGERVDARLLITVGEREKSSGPAPPSPRAEGGPDLQKAGDARGLAHRLADSRVEGLTVEFFEFAGEAHGLVILPAAGRGLRFMIAED